MSKRQTRIKKKVNYSEENSDGAEGIDESVMDLEKKRLLEELEEESLEEESVDEESDDEDYDSEDAEEEEMEDQDEEFEIEEEEKSDKPKESNKSKEPKETKHLGKKRKADSELVKDEKEKKEKTVKEKKEKKPAKEPKAPKEKKVPKEKKAPKEKKPPKEKKEKPIKYILDPNFNLEEKYFYQDLTESEWSEIEHFFTNYFGNSRNDSEELKKFFENYPKLKKGDHNMKKLRDILEDTFSSFEDIINPKLFESFKSINEFIINEFYRAKPSVHECYFFPDVTNEVHVANMLRTCKISLDIAIFTLTNNTIFAAIEEVYKRGVKVRVIADDECCKMLGSDVVRCAALGIPTKTDSNVRAHMHHKFAVIDHALVITGSFNWTAQAVKMNQENIFFYESRELAQKYTEAYDKLWREFTASITKEDAIKQIAEAEEKRRIAAEIKKVEKEKAKKEKTAALNK